MRWVTVMMIGCLLGGCRPTVAPPSNPDVAMRLVEHALGQTPVPATPERVVVLDNAALDAALALGTRPVGASVYGGLPAYLGDAADGIPLVGDANRSNLESILQLSPDLIVGNRISAGKIYRPLSQIAPTVLTEGSGRDGDWIDGFRVYADALGKSHQVERLLGTYQQRVEALQAQVGHPQAITVSILIAHQKRLGTYTTGSFAGSVLNDVGFARNPAQQSQRQYALALSRENLNDLDGDLLFLITDSTQQDLYTQAAFSQDPLWSQLQAVQQNRVCEVEAEVWIVGRGLLAARQILADIEQCLQLTNLPTSSP